MAKYFFHLDVQVRLFNGLDVNLGLIFSRATSPIGLVYLMGMIEVVQNGFLSRRMEIIFSILWVLHIRGCFL